MLLAHLTFRVVTSERLGVLLQTAREDEGFAAPRGPRLARFTINGIERAQ